MALQLTSYFSKRTPTGQARPLLNVFPTNYSRSGRNAVYSSTTAKKAQFWSFFKTRPELNAPVSARVNDTIGQVEFYNTDGKPLGRNKRIEAKRFWSDNFMEDRLKSIFFDVLCTGEGFGWKGKLDKSQLKEALAKQMPSVKEQVLNKAIDEESRKVRKFDYLASSTVQIEANNYEILRYIQSIGGETNSFDKEDIIHFKFADINGQIEGFTPVMSLLPEMILIYFIKENMLSYLRNGGVPKKVFSLPEELANSTNASFLREQLQQFGAIENRHGNLVLTGKVDVMDLEEKLKDMEYKQLALYVMGNIAYALHLPRNRIPALISDGSSGSDAGGLAEQGYWGLVEADQRKIENLLNTQLFREFGISIKFKKPYKIDTLREAQTYTMNADTIQKMQAIFTRYGKQISEKKAMSILGLDEDDIVEMTAIEEESSGMMGRNYANNSDVQGDKSVLRDQKRTEAVNNANNADMEG